MERHAKAAQDTMKIHELPLDDRPREKLLAKGAAALSNSELLAILLRSGTRYANVIDIARLLLMEADGSLATLSGMSVERMVRLSGIGKEKAATIAATFELGRRFMAEKDDFDHKSINEPDMAYRMLIPKMKGLTHEECWALFLNRSNYVIGTERLSSGGLTSTTMDIPAVVRMAIEKNATGVILSHNHPSGNPRPGKDDILRTEMLRKALNSMDISLLDHIVVCDNRYFSFSKEEFYEIGAENR